MSLTRLDARKRTQFRHHDSPGATPTAHHSLISAPKHNMSFQPSVGQATRPRADLVTSKCKNCPRRRETEDSNKRARYFSCAEVLLVGTACAALAAASTALLAMCFLGGMNQDSVLKGQTSFGLEGWVQNPASLTKRQMAISDNAEHLSTTIAISNTSAGDSNVDGNGLQVCLLMSFPNSGTSFTIHMTREATNMTTATNYALEGEIKDQPSVQAIPGHRGIMGPFLELIPNRTTAIPTNLILTKSHCRGFCNGHYCGPDRTIQTVRSFMMGCLTGHRATLTSEGTIKTSTVTYSPSLVKKAIHVMRHPLDNIVARFHLDYNVEYHIKGNKHYAKAFPKNEIGFRRWCAHDDANRHIIRSHFFNYDRSLREKMRAIPCMNDFFRYTQWHNLAFSASHDMNLQTMILHYHEYSEDFPKARAKVLDWLEMDRVGEGVDFHSGKVYRHYYTNQQKKAIWEFLREFASTETWEQLQQYDFGIEEEDEIRPK